MPTLGERRVSVLRVLVADDSAVFRRSVVRQLAPVTDIEVVAEAESGEEAVRHAAALRPDVVILDLRMPDARGNAHARVGIDAVERIARGVMGVAILVVSTLSDQAVVGQAMRAGACGYVVKSGDGAALVEAIRSVATGGRVLPDGRASES